MTDEELLLGPLLPRGKITSLIGTPGEEMATLTASVAVSYRTGIEIIPGWVPDNRLPVTTSATKTAAPPAMTLPFLLRGMIRIACPLSRS
jgi:hypothetical protein